jgi:hypothetical protein
LPPQSEYPTYAAAPFHTIAPAPNRFGWVLSKSASSKGSWLLLQDMPVNVPSLPVLIREIPPLFMAP